MGRCGSFGKAFPFGYLRRPSPRKPEIPTSSTIRTNCASVLLAFDEPRLRVRIVLEERQHQFADLFRPCRTLVCAVVGDIFRLPGEAVVFTRGLAVGPEIRAPEQYRRF